MLATVSRDALVKCLALANSIVERKSTIPILTNVKIAAEDGWIGFSSTNLDVELSTRCEATVAVQGTTTVDAKTLFDIARKLPNGDVIFSLSQNESTGFLLIKAASSRFELPTLPADQFPALGEDDLPVTFALPAPLLQRMIDKVRFAMSTAEVRYYLNGVHFHVHNNGLLRAVATDGHRLARIEAELPTGADGLPPIIVPRKTVGEMRKLVDGREGNVDVEVSTSRIRLKVDGSVLTSRLIDGQFPNYEQVIPKSAERVAVLETRPFAQAVDRISTISKELLRSVKLAFTRNSLVITCSNSGGASGTEQLEVEYDGPDFAIGFNARYLLEVLDAIESPTTTLAMTTETGPAIVKDPNEPAVEFVIMPMRV